MSLFKRWNEIQAQSNVEQREVCPNCSGKGFYQHGLEFAYIHECSVCEGSGTVQID